MKLTTWCSLSLGTGAEAVIEMTLCTISHGSQTPPQQGLVQNDGKPIASPQKSEWQRHADWLRKLYFIQLISMWKITEMSCRSESQSLLWWQLQRGKKIRQWTGYPQLLASPTPLWVSYMALQGLSVIAWLSPCLENCKQAVHIHSCQTVQGK